MTLVKGSGWTDADRIASTDAARVVSIALTGEPLPQLDDAGAHAPINDAAGLVDWLATAGWIAERLARHRDEILVSGQAWPHPVPASARGSLGAAQASALIHDVVAQCGLDIGATAVRRHVEAGEADRRLMAELPPHHGRVG